MDTVLVVVKNAVKEKLLNTEIVQMIKINKEYLKMYPITSVCKQDMINEFRKDRKMLAKIKSLKDYEMKDIASKMADLLFEGCGYWESLRQVVEDYEKPKTYTV